MAVFAYKALDKSGRHVSGEVNAPTRDAALANLGVEGIYPTELREGGKGALSNEEALAGRTNTRRRMMKPHDLAIFTRNLATLLESGVALVGALDILAEQ